MVVVVFSGRVVCAHLLTCALLGLSLTGCNDDDPKADGGPSSPSSSATREETNPTPSGDPSGSGSPTSDVPPATGPRLSLKGASLRMPEGWHVFNDESQIAVVGEDPEDFHTIDLSVFPALDQNATIQELARATQKTGGYPRGSIKPPTTLAGKPAFNVAGMVGGRYTEEFGLLHRGDIIAVEFAFYDGISKAERERLMQSVLATVELP